MAPETLENLWAKLTPEAQRFISAVLQVEREKLHMVNPLHVNDDLLKALKKVVK